MRHHLIGLARAAGILAVALAAWLAFLQATGNFHAVIPGEYYRSAQMDRASLSEWTREHRIRSVINLRGANPGDAWYDEEVAASAELGLAHYDFRMSAADHIPPAEAKALLDLLRAAPKPVLVHCRGGADRTGLVSSLYMWAVAGWGEEAAEWQLSLLYGHIGLPGLSRAWPMNESWESLEPWLGIEGS